jgi:hypothetical protein
MFRLIKLLSVIIFFLLILDTACAPAKKNPFLEKRKKGSQVNATRIGRNSYYFSPNYQKKLSSKHKK